jgi:dihydrofolate synthase/folylpolyglutamate synthase
MNILGATIAEIAAEKAGIIKENVPVITGVQDQEALTVIRTVADERKAPVYVLDEEIRILENAIKDGKEVFSLDTPFQLHEHLVLTMKGEHQIKNAALAVTAIDFLKNSSTINIHEEQIRKGLETTFWKGRFELITTDPEVIIDGAHNKEGIESLIKTLKSHYPNRKIHILYSALKDKDYGEMIERLSSIAASMHFTTFDFPRAASAQELYSVCTLQNKSYSESWQTIVYKLLSTHRDCPNDLLVVTGSLYFISEVREYLLKKVK